MKFKENRVEKEWNDKKMPALLKQIVTDAADHAKKKWEWEFVLTSIYRTPAEDAALQASGIHTFWRAADVRTKDQTQEAVNGIADYINKKWIYDPNRPTMKVCFKEPHGNNVHAHFQIHPNTRLRKPGAAGTTAEPVKPTAAGKKVLFRGEAEALTQDGIAEILDRLGVKASELWAVIDVETYGYGFNADRRPLILFERHKFSEFSKRKFDAAHSDISNKKPGGYSGGIKEYGRLERAVALDREAALKSASWGIGQVMGMNFKIAGYDDVEKMVEAMTASENDQLNAMANFIIINKLDKAMRAHDWATFARGYNGKTYAKNKYDTRLAAAYNKRRILLPDLTLRAAQVYLTFLGYDAGRIDGLPGPRTSSALNKFHSDNNLPAVSEVGNTLLATLKEKVAAEA